MTFSTRTLCGYKVRPGELTNFNDLIDPFAHAHTMSRKCSPKVRPILNINMCSVIQFGGQMFANCGVCLTCCTAPVAGCDDLWICWVDLCPYNLNLSKVT